MEPSGETQTLKVPEGAVEMCVMFRVTGAYVYVDPHRGVKRVENLLNRIKLTREHYDDLGPGADSVDHLIR
jgi:hypothetical protein